jgi:hypothetical protein
MEFAMTGRQVVPVDATFLTGRGASVGIVPVDVELEGAALLALSR